MAVPGAMAQATGAAGGQGGGQGGGAGGPYGALGQSAGRPTGAPDGTLALGGGGGNGADTQSESGGAPGPDSNGVNFGGAGGVGGSTASTQTLGAGKAVYNVDQPTAVNPGAAGTPGQYDAQAGNDYIDLGGGGGGGGGNGVVISGTGTFNAMAAIQAGDGGEGGYGQILDSTTANGSGNFYGGSGGGGGIGVQMGAGILLTLGPNADGSTFGAVAGGAGGIGGAATLANGYGTSAIGYGGNGGLGGAGIVAIGPGAFSPTITIGTGSSVSGGGGGSGGLGYGYGGTGAAGGLGIALQNGASLLAGGNVQGGAGGQGGEAVIQKGLPGNSVGGFYGGAGGAGAIGVSVDAGGQVTVGLSDGGASAAIIGGGGGNGGVASLANAYGAGPSGYGGQGGVGATGIQVLGPASTDPTVNAVTIHFGSFVSGGLGGSGGAADGIVDGTKEVTGYAAGGNGAIGGIGVDLQGGASMAAIGTVNGGSGGNGGNAFVRTYDGSNGPGTFTGGYGGNGNVGVSVARGGRLSVGPTDGSGAYGLVNGGSGGAGGSVQTGFDGGSGARIDGYAGGGGDGAAGVLVLGPASSTDASVAAVTTSALSNIRGGNGGQGGSDAYGFGVGGSGGQGGDGVILLSGASINNAGTVTAGNGGRGGNVGTNYGSSTESQAGNGGDGGVGIYVSNRGTVTNSGSVNGGNGGDGGFAPIFAGTAGNGGAAIILGDGGSVLNTGRITGGNGGNSGTEGAAPGLGGAGIEAFGVTITNYGTITGGSGSDEAPGENRDFRRLDATNFVYGDIGIVGSSLTVVNAGAINAGTPPAGFTPPTSNVPPPYAIEFTGGVNSLTLYPGATITGGVIAYSTSDTLVLGGTGADTFDVSQIDPTTPGTTYYHGFGNFQKTGSSTWTLTNTTGTVTSWDILGGALAITSDSNLGALPTSTNPGQITLDGGYLEASNPTPTTTPAYTITSGRTFILAQSGSGFITDAGVTLELTGSISDNGNSLQLAKLGAGTLLLTGDNNYTGGTSVQGGTVAIETTGGLGTGQVSLAPGTTLAFLNGFTFANAVALTGPGSATVDTGGNADTISSTITGGGALTKAGTGTLTLTGSNSYTNGTKIVGGELDIAQASGLGSGTVTMAAGTTLGFLNSFLFGNNIAFTGTGDPTINTGSNNVTIAGSINGPDALTKIGSGTLTLSGNNGYTGPTTIAEGTLLVNGSTAASVVTVEGGTTLGGSGTVGGIVAQSGATVVPTMTLRVAGNVTFQSGSTLQVQVNGTAGTADGLNASGTATLAGGTVAATTTGNFAAGQSFTLLTAAGGRTGTFSSLTTSTAFAFLTPQLVYDPTHVYLTFAANGTTPGQIASNPTQQATGNGLPPAIFALIQGLTVPQAQQALTALSGDSHASVETAAVQAAEIVSTTIFDRLWNIGGATGDAYDVLRGFGAPLPTLLRCYAPGDTTTREILSSYSVWAVGLGDFGHFGGSSGAASIDTALGGFIGGVDMPVYAGSTIWRFGVAGGYSSDDITVHDRGASGTFESAFGTLYGGVRAGAFDARFGAGASANSTTLQRTVAFPGFYQGEHSSYGGTTVQGFGEIGYRFSFNQKVFEPVAGFTAISVHQDGFREDGGIAALNGRAHDTNVQTSELGLRAEATPFASLPLVARVHLAWQHSFGDLNPAAVVAFQAGGSPFQVTGAPIDHNAALIEAGADYRATSAFTVGLNYVGTIGPRDQDHSIRGRMDYRF